jgi:hypothetical protein
MAYSKAKLKISGDKVYFYFRKETYWKDGYLCFIQHALIHLNGFMSTLDSVDIMQYFPPN